MPYKIAEECLLPSVLPPHQNPSRQTVGLGAALQRPDGAVLFRIGWESVADGYVGTGNMMYLLRLLVLRCSAKYLKLWSRDSLNLFFFLSPSLFFLYLDGIGCLCPHHLHHQILSKPSEIRTSFILTVRLGHTASDNGPSTQVSTEARTNLTFGTGVDADEMNTTGRIACSVPGSCGGEEEPSMEETACFKRKDFFHVDNLVWLKV